MMSNSFILSMHFLSLSTRALAYIRAGNKQLAFSEIERCLERDPYNIEVLILKGKLLWSVDKIDEGNEMFWLAHSVDPDHREV